MGTFVTVALGALFGGLIGAIVLTDGSHTPLAFDMATATDRECAAHQNEHSVIWQYQDGRQYTISCVKMVK